MERQLPMNEFVVFFDGCHKIYYAWEGELETIERMTGYGYDPIRQYYDGDVRYLLKDMWERWSCELRFISPANLVEYLPHLRQGDDDIEQFLSDFYDYFTA